MRPDVKITGRRALSDLAKNLNGLISVSAENNGGGDALYISNSDPLLAKMSNKGLHDEMVPSDSISLT